MPPDHEVARRLQRLLKGWVEELVAKNVPKKSYGTVTAVAGRSVTVAKDGQAIGTPGVYAGERLPSIGDRVRVMSWPAGDIYVDEVLLETPLLVSSGAWDPELSFASPGDLIVNYDDRWGEYQRIGDIVTFRWGLTTSTFTHATASGQLRVYGLPYQAGLRPGFASLELGGFSATGTPSAVVAPSDVYLGLRMSGSTAADVGAGSFPSGGVITMLGSGQYGV